MTTDATAAKARTFEATIRDALKRGPRGKRLNITEMCARIGKSRAWLYGGPFKTDECEKNILEQICKLLGLPADPGWWAANCSVIILPGGAAPLPPSTVIGHFADIDRQQCDARTELQAGAEMCKRAFSLMGRGTYLLVFTLNRMPLIFRPQDEGEHATVAAEAIDAGAIIVVFAPARTLRDAIAVRNLKHKEMATDTGFREGLQRFKDFAERHLTESGARPNQVVDALSRIALVETDHAMYLVPGYTHCLFGQYTRNKDAVGRIAVRFPNDEFGGPVPLPHIQSQETWMRDVAAANLEEHLSYLKSCRLHQNKQGDLQASEETRKRIATAEHLLAMLTDNHSVADQYSGGSKPDININ